MATDPTEPTGSNEPSSPDGNLTKATTPLMDSIHHDEASGAAVTGRRGFLKLGGLGIGVAAFAAACVQQVKVTDKMAQTGTIVPAPSTSEAPFTGSPLRDATLVLTALSLERLLVDTYQKILTSNWLTTAEFATIARTFKDQHTEHINTLVTQAKDMGQDPDAVKSNETVQADDVQPELDAITADGTDKVKIETDAITLALSLEDVIAQVYAKGGGEGTTSALRSQFTACGGTEARHCAVLAGLIGRPQVPFAFEHVAPAAMTDKAYIQANEKTLITTPGSTVGTAKP